MLIIISAILFFACSTDIPEVEDDLDHNPKPDSQPHGIDVYWYFDADN